MSDPIKPGDRIRVGDRVQSADGLQGRIAWIRFDDAYINLDFPSSGSPRSHALLEDGVLTRRSGWVRVG